MFLILAMSSSRLSSDSATVSSAIKFSSYEEQEEKKSVTKPATPAAPPQISIIAVILLPHHFPRAKHSVHLSASKRKRCGSMRYLVGDSVCYRNALRKLRYGARRSLQLLL